MRKIQKVALVAAVLGSLGLIGAGTAAAHDGKQEGKGGKKDAKVSVKQYSECTSHDVNIALLNNIGVANGVLGNLLGGEGNPGAQAFDQGSTQDCSNEAF
jgi:hypothetical protein